MKIIHKLILGFLSVTLLIWAVGYFAVTASQEVLQKSFEENSVSLAVEILNKIDRNTYCRIEKLQAYSKDLILRNALLESNKEFEKLDDIQAYINKKDKEWTSTPKEEVTPFMKKLMNNGLAKELREKMEFYEEKKCYTVFGEIFVTNRYGANVAQTGKITDYRQDDEEWWQVAKREGLYIRDVAYDESANVYSTDVGIRIDDENGKFIGVMKAVLNIEGVINIIKKLEPRGMHKEHNTMKYKLITKDGKLIYSTDNLEFLKDISYLLSEDEQNEREPISLIRKDDDDNEILYTHAHSRGYRDFKGLDWILIIEHKTEEIFAPVTKLKRGIFIPSLAITVLAILMGLFISTSIAKPLTKLSDATIKIGKGHLDTRIEVKSKDEIGQLATSFNRMVEDLEKTTVSRNLLLKEIEERKQAEEVAKQLNEELEQRVEERTQELKKAQEQLVRREKLAAVGQLASGVGHELRNPLGVIGNSVYFLNMKLKDADKKVRKHLDILQGEVRRSNRIITDLLDFARAKPPALTEGNVNPIVRDSLVGIEIPENLTVETQLYEKLPGILIDPDQIRQVFLNFIFNAFQAMPEGGRLDIKTRVKEDFVEVLFKDTGDGIPEENLPMIFEPLFTMRAKGIGLGLAIARDIIDRHKGRIEVESKVGVGTTFTLKLPIQKFLAKAQRYVPYGAYQWAQKD